MLIELVELVGIVRREAWSRKIHLRQRHKKLLKKKLIAEPAVVQQGYRNALKFSTFELQKLAIVKNNFAMVQKDTFVTR